MRNCIDIILYVLITSNGLLKYLEEKAALGSQMFTIRVEKTLINIKKLPNTLGSAMFSCGNGRHNHVGREGAATQFPKSPQNSPRISA